MEQFKCLIAGDTGVGKTSFILKLLNDNFVERWFPTIDQEYTKNYITLIEQNEQAEYKGKINMALIFFDISSKLSISNVENWMILIHKNFVNVPIKLIGNQNDKFHENKPSFQYDKVSVLSNTQFELKLKFYEWCNMKRSLLDLTVEATKESDIYPN